MSEAARQLGIGTAETIIQLMRRDPGTSRLAPVSTVVSTRRERNTAELTFFVGVANLLVRFPR
jgi:hypothetical protein